MFEELFVFSEAFSSLTSTLMKLKSMDGLDCGYVVLYGWSTGRPIYF